MDKISLQKGLTVCEKRAVKQVQWHAWHSASHCLPAWPFPMIHRVTQSLDWTSLHLFPDHCFVDKLSTSGWNLTRHVDKEICPRRQHYKLQRYHKCTLSDRISTDKLVWQDKITFSLTEVLLSEPMVKIFKKATIKYNPTSGQRPTRTIPTIYM